MADFSDLISQAKQMQEKMKQHLLLMVSVLAEEETERLPLL